MESAVLFKKNNYGKLTPDVFFVNVRNHKRIRGHLLQVFFFSFFQDLVEAT